MHLLTNLPTYNLSDVIMPDMPPNVGVTWEANGDVTITNASDEFIIALEAAIYAAAGVPLVNYRKLRAAAYILELSPEGTFNTSVGDLIDAIIKAIYGDRSELDELLLKIQAIKAQYPGD